MNSLERLTYLLGICVTVIGWSTAQTVDSIKGHKVIQYDTYDKEEEGAFLSILKIKNISQDNSVGGIEIHTYLIGEDCKEEDIISNKIQRLGVSPIPSNSSSLINNFESMSPGNGYYISIKHRRCRPIFSINTSDENVRFIESGIESFITLNRFVIITLLCISFSIIFIVTFIYSIITRNRDQPNAT